MLEAKEFFIKQKGEFEEDVNRRRNQMVQNENKLKQQQLMFFQLLKGNNLYSNH
jgi:hypothetical protein